MKIYLNKLNKRIVILDDAWKKAENMIHVISTRWVFKVKPDANGKISVFIARVVARGFEGGGYSVYSPVAQATTIRLQLAIAVTILAMVVVVVVPVAVVVLLFQH